MHDSKFDDFWRASELDAYSIADFSRKMASFEKVSTTVHLEYPDLPSVIPLARTKLTDIAKKRRSERDFTSKPLTHKQIEKIFSAFYSHGGEEHRSFPAAGALYTVEIFQVIFNGKELDRKILYYHPKYHGYTILPQQAPDWAEAKDTLNINTIGIPQSVLLFVVIPERAINKYGERGGRFALLEAGAAMQQLALTIADDKFLRGVPVGGVMDRYWLKVIGMENTDARIAIGYLVGR